MTMQNFDKGMAAFDKGMADFNKSMDQFGDGIGGKKDSRNKMEKLWGKSKSNDTNFITGKKSKSNLEKIWGTSSKKKSNSVKIWSDPVQKKRKTKSKSKHQSQMNGIIEKQYGESLKNLSSKIPKGVYVLKIEVFSFLPIYFEDFFFFFGLLFTSL
jgi:hypothetical protein